MSRRARPRGRRPRDDRRGRGPALLLPPRLDDTRGNLWTPGHDALGQAYQLLARSLPGSTTRRRSAAFHGPGDVGVFLAARLVRGAACSSGPALLGCGLGAAGSRRNSRCAIRSAGCAGAGRRLRPAGRRRAGRGPVRPHPADAPARLVFADPAQRLGAGLAAGTPSRQSASRARSTPAWRRRGWPGVSLLAASCAGGWRAPASPRSSSGASATAAAGPCPGLRRGLARCAAGDDTRGGALPVSRSAGAVRPGDGPVPPRALRADSLTPHAVHAIVATSRRKLDPRRQTETPFVVAVQ